MIDTGGPEELHDSYTSLIAFNLPQTGKRPNRFLIGRRLLISSGFPRTLSASFILSR